MRRAAGECGMEFDTSPLIPWDALTPSPSPNPIGRGWRRTDRVRFFQSCQIFLWGFSTTWKALKDPRST